MAKRELLDAQLKSSPCRKCIIDIFIHFGCARLEFPQSAGVRLPKTRAPQSKPRRPVRALCMQAKNLRKDLQQLVLGLLLVAAHDDGLSTAKLRIVGHPDAGALAPVARHRASSPMKEHRHVHGEIQDRTVSLYIPLVQNNRLGKSVILGTQRTAQCAVSSVALA